MGEECLWTIRVETDDDKFSPYKVKGLPIDKKVIKITLGANSSYILLKMGKYIVLEE